MSGFLEPVRALWVRRSLVGELTRQELRSRFVGSILGLAWLLLHPVALLGVYLLVFGVLRGGSLEFVARLYVGILVFGVFSETVTRAPRLVLSRPNYVTKVVFPLEVLPLPGLAVGLVAFAAGLLVLVAFHGICLDGIRGTTLAVPALLLPLVMLTLGVAWFVSSVGVFLRDTHEVVRVLVQLLFFLSPVIWTVEDVPEHLRVYALANPLAVVIEWIRGATAHGMLPAAWSWTAFTAVCFLVMCLGHAWFRKTRIGFADVL